MDVVSASFRTVSRAGSASFAYLERVGLLRALVLWRSLCNVPIQMLFCVPIETHARFDETRMRCHIHDLESRDFDCKADDCFGLKVVVCRVPFSCSITELAQVTPGNDTPEADILSWSETGRSILHRKSNSPMALIITSLESSLVLSPAS